MRSYFLAMLDDSAAVRRELTRQCPGQAEPWLITTADGDVVAYLNLHEPEAHEAGGPLLIKADVSGRLFEKVEAVPRDEVVIERLRSLRAELGGIVWDDFDRPV